MPAARPETPRTPADPRGRTDSSTLGFLAMGFALVAAVIIGTVLLCRSMEASTFADRQRELRNIAFALAEQTDRAFQALGSVQQSIIDRIDALHVSSSAQLAEHFSDYATHVLLNEKIHALPYVDAVTLINASGHLINFSRYWPIPSVTVDDRDYFKALSTNSGPDVFVSEPVRNRGTGTRTIYLAQRFTAPDGEFLGLVLGAMTQSYFSSFYGSIRLDKDAVIALARDDGAILARFPADQGDVASADRAHVAAQLDLSARQNGRLAPGVLDDKERQVAVQKLAHYPLAIAVSDSRRAIGMDVRRQVLPVIVASALLSLAIAIITFFAIRQVRVHHQFAQAARRMARQDSLTRLPNRTAFSEVLAEWISAREPAPFCLLFLDLDYFKSVNDTLGHATGDRLLQAVAQRLGQCVTPSDVVARLGGDEFAILRSGVSGEGQALELAQQIIEQIRAPFRLDQHRVIVGASIGISLAPRDGTSGDALLKNADLALYRAKNDGRGTARVFAASMEHDANVRRNLELDLHEAWRDGQFFVVYQPIFETRTLKLAGFEALVRWNHPQRGIVPPGEFIGVAEETGLILALGAYVLREACLAAAKWPEHLYLAVNLSAVQFRSASIFSDVDEILAATGLSPRRLELEITESVLLQEGPAVHTPLERFHSSGITISLDDFGTGYSSLSYLRTLPIGRIKIDRRFVEKACEDARSRAIIEAILALAEALSLLTTAEGVEQRDQLEFLTRVACTHIQGYLLSPPVDFETADRMALAAGP